MPEHEYDAEATIARVQRSLDQNAEGIARRRADTSTAATRMRKLRRTYLIQLTTQNPEA